MKHQLDSTVDEVVFASTVRLPFEPKGAALEARAALRAALATLKPTGHLVAAYASADAGFCDLENVLLYNVGMGSFGALAARGLLLTRLHTATSWAHQHRYRVVDALPSLPRGEVIARVAFDLPKRAHTAGDFWWLARRALEAVDTTTSAFVVDVQIVTPSSSRRSLTSLLKPLLDGVLSACHRHDGTALALVAPRLATALHASIDNVTRALVEGPAPLGVRKLVYARGDGVQWNPADDLVSTVSATMTPGPAARCVVTLQREQGSSSSDLISWQAP